MVKSSGLELRVRVKGIFRTTIRARVRAEGDLNQHEFDEGQV